MKTTRSRKANAPMMRRSPDGLVAAMSAGRLPMSITSAMPAARRTSSSGVGSVPIASARRRTSSVWARMTRRSYSPTRRKQSALPILSLIIP